MKRNSLMEECRSFITPEIKENIDFNIDIVNRIFDVLEDKKLTQRDFSRLMGKNEAEISRWMQGTHNFTINTIRKIEKALGTSIFEVVKKQNVYSLIKPNENFHIILSCKRKAYLRQNSLNILNGYSALFTTCLG